MRNKTGTELISMNASLSPFVKDPGAGRAASLLGQNKEKVFEEFSQPPYRLETN